MHRADNLTTLMCCLEIWDLRHPGTLMACPGLYRVLFNLYLYSWKTMKHYSSFCEI